MRPIDTGNAPGDAPDPLDRWLADLEARHLANLTFPEVRRALQALSSLYVERRERIGHGAALDGAGKRAAFALYYGPLHFLIARAVVRQLGAARPPLGEVLDLGCGTGAAGAAWALEAGPACRVNGLDRSPWAVEEARRAYTTLGLSGRARTGDLASATLPGGGAGIVAAWALDELGPAEANAAIGRLLEAAGRGARVLVIEPLSRRVAPWWDEAARAFAARGGASREWRLRPALPRLTARLAKAAGLDPGLLVARTLWLDPGRAPAADTAHTGQVKA